jgi:molecular chaperone DnaJ
MQAGFQMASTCDKCGGSGVSVPKGGECKTCSGDGTVRERKRIPIDIPPGVEDGMRLRVSGEGDMPPVGQVDEANPKSQAGDLFVHIRVSPDSKFSRQGSDILHMATIPFTTAILGGQVKVPTLDGWVNIKIATGTSTGDRITLSGMGMAKLNSRRGTKGDLKVEFKVSTPKYLSPNQRTIAEMLANEMGDTSAKRIMTKTETASEDNDVKEDEHKNEGFLKSAWHSITGQHSEKQESSPSEPKDDEKKKASGGV